MQHLPPAALAYLYFEQVVPAQQAPVGLHCIGQGGVMPRSLRPAHLLTAFVYQGLMHSSRSASLDFPGLRMSDLDLGLVHQAPSPHQPRTTACLKQLHDSLPS